MNLRNSTSNEVVPQIFCSFSSILSLMNLHDDFKNDDVMFLKFVNYFIIGLLIVKKLVSFCCFDYLFVSLQPNGRGV